MLFCVLDTETTGLKPTYHEVIQVATIMCDSELNELGRFSFKIRPRWVERANKKALEINGFHPRTWNPDFYTHRKALKELNRFVKKYSNEYDEIIPSGQNTKFDTNFLVEEYNRSGVLYPFSHLNLDLIDIVKIWEKDTGVRLKNRKLSTLSEYTGCINLNPHDALADAEATLDIIKWFIGDLKRSSNKDVKKRIRKNAHIKI